MIHKYTHFIKENIAPKGTKKINVYDKANNKICSIPLGGLMPITKENLYSFGLLSDIHLTADMSETSTNFDRSLSYFEQQDCLFCCHSGDMTNIGFWYNRGDTEIYTGQFAEYKRICALHSNLPVFGICGNHESYNANITDNLIELKEYTGNELYYSIKQNNDLFIFISQPAPHKTINKEELQWLYEVLEENRNIRCFIFIHVFPKNDSGSPKDCYPTAVFGEFEEPLKSLLKHYKNTILFHGHSHTKFICQELDESANYTNKNGFHSIHIPSVASSRNIELQEDETYDMVIDSGSSQGYLVNVYEDFIILNGIDFTNNKNIPIGTYKIETPIVEIEANTFIDSTGTININK